jgi:small GTP-binding protein
MSCAKIARLRGWIDRSTFSLIDTKHTDVDDTLKVVVIGDSSVGKTCLALRYLTGEFSSQTRPTIAAGFCNATVKLSKTTIDLLIWDTAGQEAYRSLTSQYYRDAKIELIVFDLTNRTTLRSVQEWHAHLQEANQVPFVTVLIGNKSDLASRQVPAEDGEAVAADLKALYRETSALTGKGVGSVFEDACEQYLASKSATVRTSAGVEIQGAAKSRCC